MVYSGVGRETRAIRGGEPVVDRDTPVVLIDPEFYTPRETDSYQGLLRKLKTALRLNLHLLRITAELHKQLLVELKKQS
jgi:hypothetical protein